MIEYLYLSTFSNQLVWQGKISTQFNKINNYFDNLFNKINKYFNNLFYKINNYFNYLFYKINNLLQLLDNINKTIYFGKINSQFNKINNLFEKKTAFPRSLPTLAKLKNVLPVLEGFHFLPWRQDSA